GRGARPRLRSTRRGARGDRGRGARRLAEGSRSRLRALLSQRARARVGGRAWARARDHRARGREPRRARALRRRAAGGAALHRAPALARRVSRHTGAYGGLTRRRSVTLDLDDPSVAGVDRDFVLETVLAANLDLPLRNAVVVVALDLDHRAGHVLEGDPARVVEADALGERHAGAAERERARQGEGCQLLHDGHVVFTSVSRSPGARRSLARPSE